MVSMCLSVCVCMYVCVCVCMYVCVCWCACVASVAVNLYYVHMCSVP